MDLEIRNEIYRNRSACQTGSSGFCEGGSDLPAL